MKKSILASAAVLSIGLTTFAQQDLNRLSALTQYDHAVFAKNILPDKSQDLRYSLHGRYSRPVKKEKLKEAKLISDFIDGYPVNWITNYVSVEILAIRHGKPVKTVSTNALLTSAQKNILDMVELGTDVVVEVTYKYKNPVTDIFEIHGMHVSVTVVPEKEAEYIGGHEQMTKYLGEEGIHKILETAPSQFRHILVGFIVNEKGEIANAKISQTSGDPKIDKLVLKSINKMPKWRPAQNSKGINVKQEFEFSVDSNGGC